MNSTKLFVSFGLVIVLALVFEAAGTHTVDHTAAEDVSAEEQNKQDFKANSRLVNSNRHGGEIRRWPFYLFRGPISGEYGSAEDGSYEDNADRQARRYYRDHRRRYRVHNRHRSDADLGLGYAGSNRGAIFGRSRNHGRSHHSTHSAPAGKAISEEEVSGESGKKGSTVRKTTVTKTEVEDEE